jgi:hypothetical protein
MRTLVGAYMLDPALTGLLVPAFPARTNRWASQRQEPGSAQYPPPNPLIRPWLRRIAASGIMMHTHTVIASAPAPARALVGRGQVTITGTANRGLLYVLSTWSGKLQVSMIGVATWVERDGWGRCLGRV